MISSATAYHQVAYTQSKLHSFFKLQINISTFDCEKNYGYRVTCNLPVYHNRVWSVA